MARQVGSVKIRGTVDGLSFYKSGGEYFVRRKGGPSRKQILKSPAFERTRENLSEFAACSKGGAYLRRQLSRLLPVKDRFAYQRMTQMLSRLKNEDQESVRGARCISRGLATKKGKELMCGFAFNASVPLQNVLMRSPFLNLQKEIVLQQLQPGKDLVFPEGATHAVISGARLQTNLGVKSCASVMYTTLCVPAGASALNLRLKPCEKEEGEGNVLYFLQVCFYRIENGIFLSFKEGERDSLACIAVDPVLREENKKAMPRGTALPFVVARSFNSKIWYLIEEGHSATMRAAPA